MSLNPENMVGPVSPERAAELHVQRIPNQVFEVFNDLIAQNLNTKGQSSFHNSRVINALEKQGFTSYGLHSDGYLNVEPSYREQGWEIELRSDPDDGYYYVFSDANATKE